MGNKQKHEKELKRKYGKLAEAMQEYHHHLDLRPLTDLPDEGLEYILANVRGIDMLDLDETGISNEGIKALTRLEYLKELRVKGCTHLDNGCIEDLNRLTGLQFLHIKDTGITIDGLLQLNALTNLEELLFSADDPALIKDKMWQLKNTLSHCRFVINSKPYHFDAVDHFLNAVKSIRVTCRFKIKNESLIDDWSNWLIKPSDSYLEAEGQGPYNISDIEWIDINPVKNHEAGKLVSPKAIDHSGDLVQLLEDLSIPYLIVEQRIRVYVVKDGTA
ncbi:MAG: hypothetical protein JWP69_1608 [Flaviaesturariibacter sp.]|nr:hypothetical protein [Flaviaesturariibacter sp.]